MDNVVLVQVVHRIQDLFDGLRCILLGELALLTNPVEQLASGRKLGDNVVLVLNTYQISSSTSNGSHQGRVAVSYPRFEPVHKLDNVRVLEPLEHV